MIKATSVCKSFEGTAALDNVSAEIKNGSVFGLIGSNGAGKSTFLRVLSGILKPDSGVVSIDDRDVFENIQTKRKFFYISDDQYFFSNITPAGLRDYYGCVYPNFDRERFSKLMKNFELDENRKINTFSKGMKKQVSIICALSSNTDYIFCDETFDGLDPVARQAVKGLLAADIADRGLTPIIASHNLRELEDICDHVGLLHRGGIIFSRDLDEIKIGIHKIQCIFHDPMDAQSFSDINVISLSQRGSLYTLTVRGTEEQITGKIAAKNPVFFEILPLSLEEIFISETEVFGYDVKKFIM